jgi:SAM-dependent methyltransferase
MKIDFSHLRPSNFSKLSYIKAREAAERAFNGAGYEEKKRCPVCSSASRSLFLTKFEIPIYRCLECRVGYAGLHPRVFDDVYSQDGYLEVTLDAYDKSRKYRQERFGRERVEIIKKYVTEGRLLDIGCGSGWFLESAGEFFRCEGVEFGDALRQWTKRQYGFRIYKTAEEASGPFDVITAFDVIEHVPDPVETLKQVARLLRPGGIGLIYTPNFDSLAFLAVQEQNNLICPPQHLFYFNRSSFLKCCELAGLELVHFETKGTDAQDIYSYLTDWKGDLDTAQLISGNDNLQSIIDSLSIANHARFVIQKFRG